MDQGSHFDWGNEIQGHLLSASSYGFVIGNVLGGPICGYFGGKKSMAVTLALTGMSQIASPLASATSYWLLFICQLVTGMCVSSFYFLRSKAGHVQKSCLPNVFQFLPYCVNSVLMPKWIPLQERSRAGTVAIIGAFK